MQPALPYRLPPYPVPLHPYRLLTMALLLVLLVVLTAAPDAASSGIRYLALRKSGIATIESPPGLDLGRSHRVMRIARGIAYAFGVPKNSFRTSPRERAPLLPLTLHPVQEPA